MGKSSLINSLKRSRVVAVGNTPGVTRTAQEVHLDKHVKLLDSPGIVFSAGSSPAAALRNCVKVRPVSIPACCMAAAAGQPLFGYDLLSQTFVSGFQNMYVALRLIYDRVLRQTPSGAWA